jgi:hypothetical protein
MSAFDWPRTGGEAAPVWIRLMGCALPLPERAGSAPADTLTGVRTAGATSLGSSQAKDNRAELGAAPRQWPRRLIALLSALCVLALCVYQTQVRQIGIANNGDFDRLLNHIGLRTATRSIFPQPFAAFDYVRGWTPTQGAYWSSYVPVINGYTHVATWLNHGRFDLRWLGYAFSVGFAFALYLLCASFKKVIPQILFGALVVLAVCDANLVAYFNSFYDEPWSLLLLLLCVTAVIRIRDRRRLPPAAIIGITGLAILLLTSKSQNVFLGVFFASGLLFLVSGRKDAPKWRQRAIPFACAGAVLLSVPLYLGSQASIYSQQNVYDGVFQELLGHSTDPAADLRWLGLPPSWQNLAGGNAYQPGNELHSADFQSFVKHGGRAKLMEFYVSHPSRALHAVLRGTRYGMKANIYYLGYKQNDGHTPGWSKPCGFCPLSTVTQSVSAQGPVIAALLYAAAIAVALAWRKRGGQGYSNAMIFLLVISAYSLFAAVFGEGLYEETKHLYLFYVSNALIGAFTVSGCAQLAISRREPEKSRPSSSVGPDSGAVPAVNDIVWQ